MIETIHFTALIKKEDIKQLIKPKSKVIQIKIHDEEVEYPTTNLYNLSKYFKIVIDNISQKNFAKDSIEIPDDDILEDYLEFLCYNTELKINQEAMISFITFCDFIQMNNIIYDQIYDVIYNNKIENLEIIIPILFRNIDDKKKIELYKKYNDFEYFKNITYNDLKLLLNKNCNITKENICEFNIRKDISLNEKNDILVNYINSVNYGEYKLYEQNGNYFLKSELFDDNFPEYDNKIIYITAIFDIVNYCNIYYKNNIEFFDVLTHYTPVRKITRDSYKNLTIKILTRYNSYANSYQSSLKTDMIQIIQKCIINQKIEITD